MPELSSTQSVSDPPAFRLLRVYAFDPSVGQELRTAHLNQITLEVPWESADTSAGSGVAPLSRKKVLHPGPVGEYLEVIDYDPASGAFYAPVDLDDPYILAQDGLPPSEGVPQFHQQMVYAVAMVTIRNFEQALGRVALWAARRVPGRKDEFVQRLRIYPHALREANAYYSPDKKALLFGYFPAIASTDPSVLPGGIVFTCLSHDVIAHETTHALLDGMHRRYIEPSNPDVLAFHEAFADIVALFQHFSHPDIVIHEITRARGDLRMTSTLLGKLAQQFGRAIGNHGALRDALGGPDENGVWQPATPDPLALTETFEPHARGAILVGAVFDAFISIYSARTADLLRIATQGTGRLGDGALHPDLAKRLAKEAANSAQHLLRMCIRALDYCPPVDITFGDYLRAIITADHDLVPNDDLGYRTALIEAFRGRGIYPLDVRSLSVESVRWQPPTPRESAQFNQLVQALLSGLEAEEAAPRDRQAPLEKQLDEAISEADNLKDRLLFVRTFSEEWDLSTSRRLVFENGEKVRKKLHELLVPLLTPELREMLGLQHDVFEVHSVRPARRIGPDGQFLLELVLEITQRRSEPLHDDEREYQGEPPSFMFRGGATVLIDQAGRRLRYCISKRMQAKDRLERQRAYMRGDTDRSLRSMYFHGLDGDEPFAALHRSRDELAEELRRRRARGKSAHRPGGA